MTQARSWTTFVLRAFHIDSCQDWIHYARPATVISDRFSDYFYITVIPCHYMGALKQTTRPAIRPITPESHPGAVEDHPVPTGRFCPTRKTAADTPTDWPATVARPPRCPCSGLQPSGVRPTP